MHLMCASPLLCTPADLYAFGWLLREIVTGEPFIRRGQSLQESTADLEQQCPRSVVELISACLAPEANQRPTAKQAARVIELSLGGQG